MDSKLVKISNDSAALSIYDRALELAIEKGSPLEQLEKFMELKDRWEKNEARKAYVKAMADFKSNPPEIGKDRHVKFATQKGITEYDHATLGNVTSKINTALSEYGLSSGWRTSQSGDLITVTCTITHIMGHSESTAIAASPDTSGGKNSIQAIGSTISYLERYTILALTGLATFDQDDDGQLAMETITEEQAAKIVDLLAKSGTDKDRWLNWFSAKSKRKINSISDMPSKLFEDAKTGLENKFAKAQTKTAEREPGMEG